MRIEKALALSLLILLGAYIVSSVVEEYDEAMSLAVDFAFAVGAAVWVWKDARRLELPHYQTWLTNSPVVAAVLTLLFTYVFLPCYVVKRTLILSGLVSRTSEDSLNSGRPFKAQSTVGRAGS